MDKLYILDVAEKNKTKKEFFDNIISKGSVTKNNQLNVLEDEGISLIEKTIPYIENIYRNANRLIVNEEEIVKIELAKKITVDSVKHLSKHTNFIQNIDERGNVEPSKILNINKEESYDTYENKLIYSLIENIKLFVRDKKEFLGKIDKNNINDKKMEYVASTNIDGKEFTVNYNVNSKFTEAGMINKIKEEIQKVKEIERKLAILTSSSIHKIFEKRHIKPITGPIKKTNMILKNVNFQYAMKLWDFLQENLGQENTDEETTKDFGKDTLLKKMMDEIFLLQYITMQKSDDDESVELSEKMKKNLLADVLEYVDMPNSQLEKVLSDKNTDKKFKNNYIEKHVRNIFSQLFKKYEKNMKRQIKI